MRNIKLFILALLLCLSCSTILLRGPVPGNEKYPYSVMTIPDYSKVVYIIPNSLYYPGIILDSWFSLNEYFFYSAFVESDKIILVDFDEKSQQYTTKYLFKFSDITTVSSIALGSHRVIRFHINNEDNSIRFMISLDVYGNKVDKDEVVNYISGKINENK